MSTFTQSEVADLLACPQRWAFGYSDRAGFPIRPKVPALRLREGKAWGAGVQEWHAARHAGVPLVNRTNAAGAAMLEQLDADAAQMEEHGVFDAEEYDDARERLIGALAHYASTAEPLNLVASELELDLAHADGWRYRCHLDGVHEDEEGFLWVVEFKWRSAGSFTPLEQIVLWRQVRWYALALQNSTFAEKDGWTHHYPEVRGVIVDERLADAPSPVRYNKDGAVSKVQSCTLDQYMTACAQRGTEPWHKTVENLTGKTWQQRHEVLFRADEMTDALHELESAALLQRLYRQKQLRPLRVPGRQCNSCQFVDLCATPDDHRLRDALYVPNTDRIGAST